MHVPDLPLDEALVALGELIGFPTVTTESNLELIAHAEDRLRAVGATVVRSYDADGAKANLFATIGPSVDGGVVLSGHTDVVPADAETWTGAPFLAALRDDCVHGRGAADMKGFIACVLAMAPRFAATGLVVPVHVALTFDEEVGCHGVPLLLDELARSGPRPAAAIVGEPTSMRIVHGHKGCYEYTTTITGVEGHASAPGAGVNAVEVGARYVTGLLALRDRLAAGAPENSPFTPPESTLSVGTFGGGTARNVIAGECRIDWELRPVRRADVTLAREAVAGLEQRLRDEIRSTHPDADLRTVAVGEVDGLEIDPDSPAVALVASLVDGLVDDPGPGVVSFGTEAGLYQQAGIPAVICGPGTIDVAHRPDEHIEVDQLLACLAMLDRLRERLAAH
jgi:acetylornithine deacetylase